MKKILKLESILLSLSMIMLCLGGMSVSAASPHLNKTEAVLVTGKSCVLTVSGASSDVKWSVSDKNVCTVKDGRVTAVSQGQAYVYAAADGVKLKCTVTVYNSYISKPSAEVTVSPGKKTEAVLKCVNVTGCKIGVSGNSAKLTDSEVFSGGIRLTFTGVSEGVSECTVSDKANPSVKRTFRVNVISSAENNGMGLNEPSVRNVTSSAGKDADEDSSTDYAEKVLELVNKERTSRGRRAVVLDEDLCAAAQIRAEELSVLFSHDRPDGTHFYTLLESMGISYTGCGENIARGQKTPEYVVSRWMGSEKHRENILGKDYTRMGIGYDPATNSWSQIFLYE